MRHAIIAAQREELGNPFPEPEPGCEANRRKQLRQSVSQADWLLGKAYLTAIPRSLPRSAYLRE